MLPEYIYVTLALSSSAYNELKTKLTNLSLTERIIEHESVEHLDYTGGGDAGEIPLKSTAYEGGDISPETCEEVKTKYLAAGLFDRTYWEDEEATIQLVDMNGTALKLEEV